MSKSEEKKREFFEALGHLQSAQELLRGGDMRPEALQYSKALMDTLNALNARLTALEHEASSTSDPRTPQASGYVVSEERLLLHRERPLGDGEA